MREVRRHLLGSFSIHVVTNFVPLPFFTQYTPKSRQMYWLWFVFGVSWQRLDEVGRPIG